MNAGFREVCHVEADLSALAGSLTRQYGPNGVYWQVHFDIALTFGATELKAYLVWEEKVGII